MSTMGVPGENVAEVKLYLVLNDTQLRAARHRAHALDLNNLGEAEPPEEYTPSRALARILASDPDVVVTLIPMFTGGYTAEENDE